MPQFGYQVLGHGAGGSAPPFYKVHSFLSSGTWECTAGGTVDILVVGGGGSGGNGTFNQGGGGAGAVYTVTRAMSAQDYTITVADGGAGVTGNSVGNDGSASKVAGADGDFDQDIYGGGGGGGTGFAGAGRASPNTSTYGGSG